MCSNFQAITSSHADWVKEQFQCQLPLEDIREEVYPLYPAPFISVEEGKPKCELSQFGLVPAWAADRPKFGTKTYNARSETVAEKPSYRNAWKRGQFGLALMQSFYEPNYESGKAIRWRIKRTDGAPLAVASIWERYIDHVTGEIRFSFALLTVNATDHAVMRHFHRPEDEKRSVVVLADGDYHAWLNAGPEQAQKLIQLPPESFLKSEPAPKK